MDSGQSIEPRRRQPSTIIGTYRDYISMASKASEHTFQEPSFPLLRRSSTSLASTAGFPSAVTDEYVQQPGSRGTTFSIPAPPSSVTSSDFISGDEHSCEGNDHGVDTDYQDGDRDDDDDKPLTSSSKHHKAPTTKAKRKSENCCERCKEEQPPTWFKREQKPTFDQNDKTGECVACRVVKAVIKSKQQPDMDEDSILQFVKEKVADKLAKIKATDKEWGITEEEQNDGTSLSAWPTPEFVGSKLISCCSQGARR